MVFCTGIMQSFCSKMKKVFGKRQKKKKTANKKKRQSKKSKQSRRSVKRKNHPRVSSMTPPLIKSHKSPSAPNLSSTEVVTESPVQSSRSSAVLTCPKSRDGPTPHVPSNTSTDHHSVVCVSPVSSRSGREVPLCIEEPLSSLSSSSFYKYAQFDRDNSQESWDNHAPVRLFSGGWKQDTNQVWGCIKAKELAGEERRVFIRWTANNWSSYTDTNAELTISKQQETSKLSYTCNITVPEGTEFFEFAVAYQVDDCFHWDNNDSVNYKFTAPCSASNSDSSN